MSTGSNRDPLMTGADAQIFVERLWRTYSSALSPYLAAPPVVVVLYADRLKGARAECLHHRILIDEEHCRRCGLAHETARSRHVDEQHGPGWISTMLTIWRDEFDVPIGFSVDLAREAGIEL